MYEATKTIPQASDQENASDCFRSPIKEIFHLEQPWLEVPTVSLLCWAPVLSARGKANIHQNSSKLIRSLDECLGLC